MPKYTRLTNEQRHTMETLLRKGQKPAAVARDLGVHRSSISRELSRNGMKPSNYRHDVAMRRATKEKSSKNTSTVDPAVWAHVERKLRNEQWSPEQISENLKKSVELPQVSHETIYRHIYLDKKAGGDLHQNLRHRIKSYKKRGAQKERRGRIRNAVSIDERPAIVNQKGRQGDWEMDTVIGRPGGAVLVTMVERKSRLLRVRLAASKEALAVSGGILEGLKSIKDQVQTLTYDNGKEFAKHELISDLLEAQGYFAHPYHSWERGLNENTNGLLRQYFPKKSSFDELTPERVLEVENLLNNRPRKCLDWQTPQDICFANAQPPPVALAS